MLSGDGPACRGGNGDALEGYNVLGEDSFDDGAFSGNGGRVPAPNGDGSGGGAGPGIEELGGGAGEKEDVLENTSDKDGRDCRLAAVVGVVVVAVETAEGIGGGGMPGACVGGSQWSSDVLLDPTEGGIMPAMLDVVEVFGKDGEYEE